ncbi:hypothetical protein [Geodermatophilus sp. FMUSA9-8]|uniref:hypothetical protein n=1 Tax=Geodermatophilus sp. FMUSA9-8 TaxID=3120155 RepID=UPI0030092C6B
MTTPMPTDPVRSALELTNRWADLLAPPLFASRSIWLSWLTPDGRQTPFLVPVEDVPARPRHRLVAELLALHEDVAAPAGGSEVLLAMALCRPGRPGVTADDRAWADAFRDVLDDALGTCWSLHLAAGGRVEPLTDVRYFLDRFASAEDGAR